MPAASTLARGPDVEDPASPPSYSVGKSGQTDSDRVALGEEVKDEANEEGDLAAVFSSRASAFILKSKAREEAVRGDRGATEGGRENQNESSHTFTWSLLSQCAYGVLCCKVIISLP